MVFLKKVTVYYYGSFAQTHRGHGTDYAIAAGIMGLAADDYRVPNAIKLARKRGIDIRFVEEEGDSPIGHPNTALLDLKTDDRSVKLIGCSIGGGTIEIRGIEIFGIKMDISGPLPIIIYKIPFNKLYCATELMNYLNKVAPYNKQQSFNGTGFVLYEFDIINYISPQIVNSLHKKYPGIICL